ncbi:MAG: M23 family metallopeptidase [Desulfosporosinus sp.]|nr:M23 family metallopeptidase [Desulfosporosinus sp.]
MIRWQSLSKSWILVWGSIVLVGGLIFYTQYQSSIAQAAQKSVPKITKENALAVSTRGPVVQGTDGKRADIVSRTQSEERGGADAKQSAPGQSTPKILSSKDFPSPVQGRILRKVGNYYSQSLEEYLFHAGTDYAEPEGTMIRATQGGKVVAIGRDPILGQSVTLDCGEGWIVTYGGLDNLRVQAGETVVTQGALGQIGFQPGADGERERPQLHYEVWHNNQAQKV